MVATQTSSVFPSNFLWGAATSAHQVEGNNHNDWTEWEKLGRVKNHERSGRAAGHWQRFREDFALAKGLGQNAHRFSIEWSRIEPKPGRIDVAAIEHYRDVLTELRRLGLEPVVTLHHFTNPIWIRDQGGWTNPDTVNDFGRYVLTVIRELGSLATYWITLNEPTISTSLGYISDLWPPQKKSLLHAWWAIRNLAKAHHLAYRIIHRHHPSAKVGVANNLSNFVPSRTGNWFDRRLTAFSRYWHNQWWIDETHQTQDFIGLNYYFHHPLRFQLSSLQHLLKPDTPPHVAKSDLGWEINPYGLGQLLGWLHRYNRPIMVTENGIADATDRMRPEFIRQHVAQIAAAIKDGARVIGYLHWSLLDNFEWHEGFGPRFGLVEVDYTTLARIPRPSASVYAEICRTNGAAALNP